MDEFLESLAFLLVESAWFSPLLALLAGVVTAFSPCCLASVPLILGYVGGQTEDVKKSFKLTLFFSTGMALVSTALGIIVASVGSLIQLTYLGGWWYVVLGVLMFLMAFQVLGMINLIPSTHLTSKNKKKGNLGAFLTGILAGIFSSPCSTPVLVAILALVAQKGNILYGGFLLLLYSIGHSVLFILAGTSTGAVKKFMRSTKYKVASKLIKYISTLILVILGVYLLYIGL